MTRCIRLRWPFTNVTPRISGARMLAVLAASLALVLAGLAVSAAGAADLAPGGYGYDAGVGVADAATSGVAVGRETVAAWGDAAARGGRHEVRLAATVVAPNTTSLVDDAVTTGRTASTAWGRTIDDFEQYADQWRRVSAHAEGATGRAYRGGASIEEVFERGGDRLVRHRIYGPNGEILHETFRPYAKFGAP